MLRRKLVSICVVALILGVTGLALSDKSADTKRKDYEFRGHPITSTGLDHLTKGQNYRAARVSSYDRRGGNNDFVSIDQGQTQSLAELKGPGQITHIWFAVKCKDPQYLRRLILRIYWDGASTPAVESPLGDFFGIGHARAATYQCAFFSTSSHTPHSLGACFAMNCWVPMPFARSARIEIVNDCETAVRNFYYYIDYRILPTVPDDMRYFHAQWRREHFDGDGKNNYLVLDTEGRGHFVGCNLSVSNWGDEWWGEGDDMFFIDGEPFPPSLHGTGHRSRSDLWAPGVPPSLHGTGTEDYFCHALGMQYEVSHQYCGVSLAVRPIPQGDKRTHRGLFTCYRLHVMDPVPFAKSLIMSIEHGHANFGSGDWSSVAYWYLDNPEHKQYAPLPDRAGRDPLKFLDP